MNDNKRKFDEKDNQLQDKSKKKSVISEDSILYQDFIKYQTELDTRNDKHERLVKLSRDVTIQSKRAIFSLLRKGDDQTKIIADGRTKIYDIKKLLESINVELKNEDLNKFHRAFSPGVQEFVEAASLLYYLDHSRVITYSETVQLYFNFEESVNFLTHFDYMYGIADLTGELMRMAINAIGNRDFDSVEEICMTLKEIHSNFSSFGVAQREMTRKLNVMKNSLRKVENALYNLKVRGSEIPSHLLTDLLDVKYEGSIVEE